MIRPFSMWLSDQAGSHPGPEHWEKPAAPVVPVGQWLHANGFEPRNPGVYRIRPSAQWENKAFALWTGAQWNRTCASAADAAKQVNKSTQMYQKATQWLTGSRVEPGETS